MNRRKRFRAIPIAALILASAGYAAAQTPVGGRGTAGKVTKWTSATTVGDSVITENKVGRVGVGTDDPTSRLTVVGVIESVSNGGTIGGGFKFPDGSVQKSAGLGANQIVGGDNVIVTPTGNTVVISTTIPDAVVAHDATLAGDGTAAAPLSVSFPLELIGERPMSSALVVRNEGGEQSSGAEITASNTDSGAGGFGLRATGGRTDDGTGGDGLVAFGGDGSGAERAGGIGIVARGGSGLRGAAVGRAGLFVGDVDVLGDVVTSGSATRTTDHPLDPANRLLRHASVESSEELNVYSGNAVTDGRGVAVVSLPDWFEAVNTDVRYQLTVVGTFARAIVAEEVRDNRFTIETDEPNVKVSWQLTGVRADAAAKMRPFQAVEKKPEAERGYYLTPEAFGQPAERGVEWARHPELPKRSTER